MMKKIRLNPMESFICEILKDEPQIKQKKSINNPKSKLENSELLDLSIKNELGSIIADIGNDFLIDEEWYRIRDQTRRKIESYLLELDKIAYLFKKFGIPIIALKNAGIVRGIYKFPSRVPMGDIDILIEKKNFKIAHKLLLTENYHFKFRSVLENNNIEEAEGSGGSEYWKILPNGEKFWLELQWRPVAGRWIRPDQEPDASELFERSLPIRGTSVRLLSPEDNLLQVCLHTAKHSYVRAPGFRLHLDVERIVNGQEVNWDVFLERVKLYKVKTAVYFSLLIPHELFQTPIPEKVLKKLKPSKWKEQIIISMINDAGLFNPDEKKFSKAGYIFFNMLLYDDLKGLFLSIFPPRASIKAQYPQFHKKPLFLIYLFRISNLIFRRNKV